MINKLLFFILLLNAVKKYFYQFKNNSTFFQLFFRFIKYTKINFLSFNHVLAKGFNALSIHNKKKIISNRFATI